MSLKIFAPALLALVVACAGTRPPSVYKASSGAEITYGGSGGGSYKDAIVIRGATRQIDAVNAEYHYISDLNGHKDKSWHVYAQSLFNQENRVYDVVQIDLIPSNEKRIYYFDITRLPWEKINQ